MLDRGGTVFCISSRKVPLHREKIQRKPKKPAFCLPFSNSDLPNQWEDPEPYEPRGFGTPGFLYVRFLPSTPLLSTEKKALAIMYSGETEKTNRDTTQGYQRGVRCPTWQMRAGG